MKKIKNIFIFTIILIISLLIIALNFLMIDNLNLLNTLLYQDNHNPDQNTKYRIALVYKDTGLFTDSLSQGAIETVSKRNIYLKPFSSKPTDQFSVNDYFKLALSAKYDGIIVDGESPDLLPLIKQAHQTKIPVVIILSDLPGSDRISYVGVDNYRAGFIIGREMLKKIPDPDLRLAIISTDFTTDNYTPSAEYLKIFGFKEAISAIPNAEIITWEKTKPSMLDALQITSELIAKYPEINGIFTTQTVTTLAAATVLSNIKEQDIILIGYGDNGDIKHYIARGIINAAITINPHQIGSNAVMELISYLAEKKVNLYRSIEINFLTPEELK